MPDLRPPRWPRHLTLFWRTFLYLVLLLTGCILAWVQTFRALEFEPQALQNARQVATMVNLTRAALEHADAIARVSLVKTLADEERVRIAPREPHDTYTGYGNDAFSRRVALELTQHLGPGTIVAREVNGFEGLWVAFTMEEDTYWLLLDPRRLASIQGSTWLIWLATAALLSLTGAAVLARLINRPLQQLSAATRRVREGQLDASHLDENVSTPEIRAVNKGFNRMARQLAQMETDRRLMLAGISHDLRTPLARLRLEAEMSVPDPQARSDMVADMAQVDGIIEKFLEYARPESVRTQPVDVGTMLQDLRQVGVVQSGQVVLSVDALPSPLLAQADQVDLQRVLNNLLENAARYGKTPGLHQSHVDVTARVQGDQVLIELCDHGPGVSPDTLPRLKEPFFRADEARSQTGGAGLGLAIVDKMLKRMGGEFKLSCGTPRSAPVLRGPNAPTAVAPHSRPPAPTGLVAQIALAAVPPQALTPSGH